MEDYRDKYNTQLTPDEEAAFADWVKEQSAKQQRDVINDLADYDLKGFWKNQESYADNGHGSDKYKKPNHPTFSNQSVYHGVDGNEGGEWSETEDGRPSFRPSNTNMNNTPLERLQAYFNKVEPDAVLERSTPNPRFPKLQSLFKK
jgi:hypothetical protein